ncbi:NUDIX domain-containing protein [Halenospora varia]|nr:NUDIX domain-containing protein [Halenospora varia]
MAESKTFLDLINAVDSVPNDFEFTTLYRLFLPQDTRPHGFMLPSIVSQMPWSSDFVIDHDSRTVQLLDSSDGKDTGNACCAAFKKVIDTAIDSDIFTLLHGTHSEMYKILGAKYFVCLERFAAPLFGISSLGAHMTAYVRTPTGLKIWVARRSAHLFTYPGMLDTTVAGGVKADHLPFDCILAEADEEASIPTEYVQTHAHAVGIVSYVTKNRKTGLVSPTILYNYDLELPETIAPQPKDDEVEGFYLWSVEEVQQAMLREEFKPNCNLVMLDFFIRHGIMTQENQIDYVEIANRLTRRLPIPTTSIKKP